MEHDLEVSRRSSAERDLITPVSAAVTHAEHQGSFEANSTEQGAWAREGGSSRGIQFQDLTSLGGDDAFQMLELQNMNLQV